jgi:DNA anti-recombination protein RmuC
LAADVASRKINNTTADFSKIFSLDKTLAHLWREYRHTLHEQRDLNQSTGSQEVTALRATVSAEAIFSTQTLVDNRLRTEFFKHLPGICTGLGIIGTFLGLLQGLNAFTVSENAQVVRTSLEALLHGVFEAFLVSAAAIAVAMAITLIEKLMTSSLYKAVEVLAHRIDEMFEAGMGEEYLERLVRASEDSATQAKILKDALVADLKELLSDLTQQQIRATGAGSAQIVSGLQTSFTEPLAQIARAVEGDSKDQGQAVTKLLTDVLAGFSQRLQDLFGKQITGINELQQKAVDPLQTAVEKLDQMATGIDAAGQKATDAMAGKISETIDALDARFKITNDRMAALAEQIGASTTSTIDKMNAGAGTLNAAVGDFAIAAQGMTDLMLGTTKTSEALTHTAGSLTAATRVLENVVKDHHASRDVLDHMLTELRTTVENAKKEASLTSDILTRIDSATTKLAQAQNEAENYLEKIGEVLAASHQEFSDNMAKTLGVANRQFYDQMTQATALLRTGIQELEATLATLNAPN